MRALCVIALPAGLAVAGCSGTGGPEAGAPALVGESGRVRVEIGRGAAPDLTVGIHFLRYRDLDGGAAELLAGGDQVPPEGCLPPAGPPALDDLLALLPESARIEHLDAGEITVLFDGLSVSAAPARLPALSPWVVGVEYDDQRARGGASLPEDAGEVLVNGLGGAEIGPFEASLSPAPGAPTARLDGDLVVTWPAGPDEIIVTVDGPAGPVCRAATRAAASPILRIPAGLLPHTEPLTVTVERIRRAPLGAPGLARAELEVVVRDVLTASSL